MTETIEPESSPGLARTPAAFIHQWVALNQENQVILFQTVL